MKFNSQREYNSKREEVLSKFREDFAKNYYNYDAMFHAIAEMLIRGADPYVIIEELIKDRKRLIEKIAEPIDMVSAK